MKLILFLGTLLLSCSVFSQEKLEQGRYISSDKLKYITIKNDYQFEYNAYKGYSPYTIKKENKPNGMCGTIGYWGDGRGKGTYSIVDEELILKFDIDYSTIATKKIDIKLLKGLRFKISELEKLEDEK
ncbi:hypothetical protein [Psychroserpens damuponensis]|jgi:hypothetical protein|uniref:hypothetical protein n=1 Tax=Psychroserpens damuponensis TaxID=943936 RepID=UPI00058E2175|nr:hypothetical protein [Psychroserpens damuponensis]